MHLDAERLVDSSRMWMAAAFAAFADGPPSEGMAVHHAGVATEHLLKAYLVSLHPVLIVDGNHFSSLLYATGHGDHLQVQGSQTRTIQLGEAYDRVEKILKGKIPAKPRQGRPWPIADARNGVAHGGYHDPAEAHKVFTSCIKVIDPLLVELEVGPGYWGEHKGLHDELLIEGVEAARVLLEQKLARARRVFAERYGHIDEGSRKLVLTTVAQVVTPMYLRNGSDYSASVVCPACSSQGSLIGLDYVDKERWVVVMTPLFFECFVCELRLETSELGLLPSSLAGDVDLDISPEEYYSNFEPDEDDELDSDEAGDDGEQDYSARLLAYRKRM
ncbi:hypothetical protein ABT025_01170 [Streptomyces sp. NPDC002809]|uniref:hypothetical protein n=1 Tax=Streptomyces sp. NPDC002809 TaxID=3154433 RepID=UPI00332EDE76